MAAAPAVQTLKQLTPEQVVASQAQVSFPLSMNYGDFWLLHDPETSSATRLWWLPDAAGEVSHTQPQAVLPEPHSLRSRVHEYGGMPYTLGHWSAPGLDLSTDENSKPLLIWVEEADQQLYCLPFDPTNASPADTSQRTCISGFHIGGYASHSSFRYGEPVLHAYLPWVIAIEEEHAPDAVINRLVAFHLTQDERKVLAEGADFYTSPTLSPDGQQLVWVQWHHPHQPWCASQLAALNGPLSEALGASTTPGHQILLNGEIPSAQSSLQQPRFAPNGQLYFLSDQHGFWGLYRFKDKTRDAFNTDAEPETEPVYTPNADCGSAPWQFGGRHFQFFQQNNTLKLITAQCTQGLWQLVALTLPESLCAPITQIDILQSRELNPANDEQNSQPSFFSYLSIAQDQALYQPAPNQPQPDQSPHLICLTAGSNQTLHLTKISLHPEAELHQGNQGNQGHQEYRQQAITAYQSLQQAPQPERICLKLPEHPVYGIYHPRTTVQNPASNPLLIIAHGGPTSCAFPGLQLMVQFWCQQGFNVLELDHRGSTGYGREYRELLQGEWGEADLEDARLFSHYLQQHRGISANKVAIRGHSAGGYICMRAAALGYFDAVVSLYGISDLERLAASTHKFESHYPDWLIADARSNQMLYQLRSPRFNLCQQQTYPALLMFQGGQDRVVPPEQSLQFKNDYQSAGGDCELVLYPQEGHGFRQYTNRLDQLQQELSFYQQQELL